MEEDTPIEGSSGHGLLMPFDTDDEQFARGFECGRVYQMLGDIVNENDEDDYDGLLSELCPLTVHAVNAEMLIRVAERYELAVKSEELGDGWLNVWFGWEDTVIRRP